MTLRHVRGQRSPCAAGVARQGVKAPGRIAHQKGRRLSQGGMGKNRGSRSSTLATRRPIVRARESCIADILLTLSISSASESGVTVALRLQPLPRNAGTIAECVGEHLVNW